MLERRCKAAPPSSTPTPERNSTSPIGREWSNELVLLTPFLPLGGRGPPRPPRAAIRKSLPNPSAQGAAFAMMETGGGEDHAETRSAWMGVEG